jgi:hypothetical protein
MKTVMDTFSLSRADYFSPDSKPYGLTYGQWTVKWWQWAHSISKLMNPVTDQTGVNAGINQEGPVWFLAGTFGEKKVAKRLCCMPYGKAILFPVINYEMNELENSQIRTGPELVSHVKKDIDDIIVKKVFVNGNELPAFRVQSDPVIFGLYIVDDNSMNIPGGYTRAAADGYWVFLKPLVPGTHNIYFHGACAGGNRNAAAEYRLSIANNRVSCVQSEL